MTDHRSGHHGAAQAGRGIVAQLLYEVSTTEMHGSTGVGGRSWIFLKRYIFRVRPHRSEQVRIGDQVFTVQQIIHLDRVYDICVRMRGDSTTEYERGTDAFDALDDMTVDFMRNLISNGWIEETGWVPNDEDH